MTTPPAPPSGSTPRPSISRRADDRSHTWLVVIGTLLCLGAILLRLLATHGCTDGAGHNMDDVLEIALVFIGAGMIPGSHVVDLLRAWRRGGDA